MMIAVLSGNEVATTVFKIIAERAGPAVIAVGANGQEEAHQAAVQVSSMCCLEDAFTTRTHVKYNLI